MNRQIIKQLSIRSTIYSVFLAVAFLAFGFVSARANGDCETRECRRDLARARRATAQYHDINVAQADGFQQASPCVAVPSLGAMGFHFVNFARTGNPSLEVSELEALLYIPENGEMRLVAVEYIRFGPPTPPAPVLFGQEFDYNPNLGAWTLHVWIWRHNPAGMFAEFNPKLSCP
jgi:hypothetical protein